MMLEKLDTRRFSVQGLGECVPFTCVQRSSCTRLSSLTKWYAQVAAQLGQEISKNYCNWLHHFQAEHMAATCCNLPLTYQNWLHNVQQQFQVVLQESWQLWPKSFAANSEREISASDVEKSESEFSAMASNKRKKTVFVRCFNGFQWFVKLRSC